MVVHLEPIATAPIQSVSIALAVPKATRQQAQFRMQTQHTVAPGNSAFQFWQRAMSTFAFPSAQRKERGCLSFPAVSLRLTVAALRNSSSFTSWEAAYTVCHFSLPPSSHPVDDGWLGLEVPRGMQWTYEASCLDVPSTAIGSQCSRRSAGCMMSEGGGD